MPGRRVALKPGIHSLGEMMEGAVLAFFQVVASSQIFPLCRIVPVSALSRSPWHRFAAAKVITIFIICNPGSHAEMTGSIVEANPMLAKFYFNK